MTLACNERLIMYSLEALALHIWNDCTLELPHVSRLTDLASAIVLWHMSRDLKKRCP